jgi:hypothetical protein
MRKLSLEINDEASYNELRESLASTEHDRWSRWMKYLFTKGKLSQDGTFILEKESYDRWLRQSETDYSDLSTSEKDSDRKEADNTLDILHQYSQIDESLFSAVDAVSAKLGELKDLFSNKGDKKKIVESYFKRIFEFCDDKAKAQIRDILGFTVGQGEEAQANEAGKETKMALLKIYDYESLPAEKRWLSEAIQYVEESINKVIAGAYSEAITQAAATSTASPNESLDWRSISIDEVSASLEDVQKSKLKIADKLIYDPAFMNRLGKFRKVIELWSSTDKYLTIFNETASLIESDTGPLGLGKLPALQDTFDILGALDFFSWWNKDPEKISDKQALALIFAPIPGSKISSSIMHLYYALRCTFYTIQVIEEQIKRGMRERQREIQNGTN